MEILSRPTYLSSEIISSGLDEITQGIAQSTETSGPVALQNAIDVFSPENIGYTGQEWGAGSKPAVIGESASFADPAEYLRSYTDQATPNNSQFPDVLTQLQDPKFNAGDNLARLSQNLFRGQGIVDSLIGKEGMLAKGGVQVTGVIAPPQNPVQLTGVIAPPQNPVELTGVIAPPQNPVQLTGVIAPPQNPVQLTGVIAPPQNPVQLTGVIAPPQNPVQLTGVIAPPQMPYELAGGIIPPQTSIDDSLNNMTNLDPLTPEGQQNLAIFQQQLGALNNLEGTVKKQVGLQQQMDISMTNMIFR
jgi:hypothetical protein